MKTIDYTSEEFWKDAPEGATHWDNAAKCFCKKEGYWHLNNKNRYVEDDDQNQWGDLERYEPHPKPSPVFTQEFRVIGGTSEVWQKCKVLFTGKKYTVVENENGREFSRKTVKLMIRDITPPIELIDGKAYQFDVRDKGGLVSGIYNEYDNKLHVGPSHYFDLLSATNIQQLTVEGE